VFGLQQVWMNIQRREEGGGRLIRRKDCFDIMSCLTCVSKPHF
jgi:hypothetical protein